MYVYLYISICAFIYTLDGETSSAISWCSSASSFATFTLLSFSFVASCQRYLAHKKKLPYGGTWLIRNSRHTGVSRS